MTLSHQKTTFYLILTLLQATLNPVAVTLKFTDLAQRPRDDTGKEPSTTTQMTSSTETLDGPERSKWLNRTRKRNTAEITIIRAFKKGFTTNLTESTLNEQQKYLQQVMEYLEQLVQNDTWSETDIYFTNPNQRPRPYSNKTPPTATQMTSTTETLDISSSTSVTNQKTPTGPKRSFTDPTQRPRPNTNKEPPTTTQMTSNTEMLDITSSTSVINRAIPYGPERSVSQDLTREKNTAEMTIIKAFRKGLPNSLTEFTIKEQQRNMQQVMEYLEQLVQNDTFPDTNISEPYDRDSNTPNRKAAEITSLSVTTNEILTNLSTSTPEEHLQEVLEHIEQLLLNDTLPVTSITEPFDRVDEFLARNVTVEKPNQLLQLLDMIGNKLQIDETGSAKVVRNNIALLVTNAHPKRPVRGLRIAARETDTFNNDAFEIMRGELESTLVSSNESEIIVQLPSSVATSSRRISFVVFRTDQAFYTNSNIKFVNSRIISINVENTKTFHAGEVISIYFRPIVEPLRNQSQTCGYWKFNNDGTGSWTQDGCTFIEAFEPGMMDSCQCTHLTHFAAILVFRTVFSELDEQILKIISVIGCSLSIFGITMVAITAVLFKSWRKEFNNKIWLQLCLSILLLIISFLITALTKYKKVNLQCMFLGIILHFSVLASFCWMLVAAIMSYRRLVTIFPQKSTYKLLKASAFAWGCPTIVVSILVALTSNSYRKQFEDITPTSSFCYPSGLALWLSVYTPIAMMLLINWILFSLILRSVCRSKQIEKYGDSNEAKRCITVSCLLVFAFGLPWIFGLFAQNIIAAYLFAITGTFQGLILFIFFVIVNKKTRALWLKLLKINQKKQVTITTSNTTRRTRKDMRVVHSLDIDSVEAKVLLDTQL